MLYCIVLLYPKGFICNKDYYYNNPNMKDYAFDTCSYYQV